MSITLNQSARTVTNNVAATSATATLSTPATAGNLLIGFLVVDKAAGGFTATPAGWTDVHAYDSANVSVKVVQRLASGGETGLTLGWTTSELNNVLSVHEFTLPAGWTPTLALTAQNSGTSNVTAQVFTNVALSGAGLLLGLGATDSVQDTPASANPSSWSGAGWTQVYDTAGSSGTSSGVPVHHVSQRTVTGAESYSSTFTHNTLTAGGTASDQDWAGLLFIPDQAAPTVTAAWNGVPEPDGATVSVKTSAAGTVSMQYSTAADFSAALETAGVATNAFNIARVRATGLLPGTTYYTRFLVNGQLTPALTGKFRTAPSGFASFSFATGSCANVTPSNTVWARIAAKKPLFFAHLGDIHYNDTNSTVTGDHVTALMNAVSAADQQNVWRHLSTAYTWSDHDFCGQDSHAASTGAAAAQAAVRAATPYAYSDSIGAWYAFTAGRVRVIVTDLRSYMTPVPSVVDDPSASKMGAAQKAWFKQQCLSAKARGQVIVWLNSEPYVGSGYAGNDEWTSYSVERRELSNFFQANDLYRRLLIVNGDAHSLAYDDGTHTNYATTIPSGEKGPALVQTAPLNAVWGVKGGPYTAVQASGTGFAGQYGVFNVTDLGGDTVTIRADLYTSDASGGGTESLWGTFTATLQVQRPRYLGLVGETYLVLPDPPVEVRDVLTSSSDGVQTTFTLAQVPRGAVKVQYGGTLLWPDQDYTLSGTTVTLLFTPEPTSRIAAMYPA